MKSCGAFCAQWLFCTSTSNARDRVITLMLLRESVIYSHRTEEQSHHRFSPNLLNMQQKPTERLAVSIQRFLDRDYKLMAFPCFSLQTAIVMPLSHLQQGQI